MTVQRADADQAHEQRRPERARPGQADGELATMPLEPGRGEFRRLCEAFVTQALRLPEWANYEWDLDAVCADVKE